MLFQETRRAGFDQTCRQTSAVTFRSGGTSRSSWERPCAGSCLTLRTLFEFSLFRNHKLTCPSLGRFYGINLNQNVVLQQIGFAGTTGTAWTRLFKIAVGNMIITALGFVPGYYVNVLLIEKLGRKWIQTQGFLMAALFREYTITTPH